MVGRSQPGRRNSKSQRRVVGGRLGASRGRAVPRGVCVSAHLGALETSGGPSQSGSVVLTHLAQEQVSPHRISRVSFEQPVIGWNRISELCSRSRLVVWELVCAPLGSAGKQVRR